MASGETQPIKEAFGEYLKRFYAGIYPTTPGMTEFVARGIARSMVFAPGRMIDAAEDMLKSYQRNTNSETANSGALLPVIIVAMSKDYMPTGGDWAGRQVSRMMVALDDADDASVYGYRQAMGDIRAQVVIFAADEPTARGLAIQLSHFVGDIENRRFDAIFKWGEYELEMPVMLETPDTMFQTIPTDATNITVLAGDLTLKVTIPYLDAPTAEADQDATDHDPKGYKTVEEVYIANPQAKVESTTTEDGSTFADWTPPE